jgi:hypothetical protein
MRKVRVYVVHTSTGEVVAIGRATGARGCVPLSGDRQGLLEVEIDEKRVSHLHQTHAVDIARKILVERKKQRARQNPSR